VLLVDEISKPDGVVIMILAVKFTPDTVKDCAVVVLPEHPENAVKFAEETVIVGCAIAESKLVKKQKVINAFLVKKFVLKNEFMIKKFSYYK
jgi:hypothetical protein